MAKAERRAQVTFRCPAFETRPSALPNGLPKPLPMPSTLRHPSTMEITEKRSFVRAVLPWTGSAVMLLVYLVTLDKSVTVQSIGPLARAAGMDWHATYTAPLTYLVTLPIRWL